MQAVAAGADPSVTGVLVDEQFGSTVPEEAHAQGLRLAMPAERSGQEMFDFQYGEDFGEHIERFDPDFTKVLVRYNPDGDAQRNREQRAKLKRLSDWLHEHERKFLFELLVPATAAQLEAVGGDSERYDAELRPELMRRTIAEAPGRGDRGGRVEDRGRGRARGLRDARRAGSHGRARRGRVRGARPRRGRREGRPLARRGRARGGLRGLRDRALDLVGPAQSVRGRQDRTARRRRSGSRENYLRFVKVYERAEGEAPVG